jgi:dihydrofolate synthase / folylpolyglutamate synthase
VRLRAWLPLRGAHHTANAALAMAAVQAVLPGRRLPPARLMAGLAAVRSPGRGEMLAVGGARVVLDGAHDADAATASAATVAEIAPGRRAVVVLGLTGGRDPARVVGPLRGLASEVIVTAADVPGALPVMAVASRVCAEGLPTAVEPDPRVALARALVAAGDGPVLVTGSLALVGVARAHLAAIGGVPERR